MADDVTPLASLSLTHVSYNPEDPVSHLCAWLALVPQALCVVYATLIWSTREAEVALMFAGQLACEAANFVLKRIIKEERPRHIHRAGGKGYGMPSSHAQFAFFWAVSLALFLLVRHQPSSRYAAAKRRNNKNKKSAAAGGSGNGATVVAGVNLADIERFAHDPWSFGQRALVSVAALVLAGLIGWSRVYLGYHTGKQVLAGCAAGTTCAIGWFGVTEIGRRTGLLAWALDMPVARWFRLRDLVVEEDLPQAGWEKWENQRVAAASSTSTVNAEKEKKKKR